MEIKGKNVAITGASTGIGLEILKLLLENDCHVAACARHIEKINIKNDNLFLCKCDVSKKDDIDSFFDFAIDKLGSIDLYISNAGFAYYEKIEDPDWSHVSDIVNTNFTSMVYAAEKMKKMNGNKPYNFLVTASAMGLLSLPGYALYSATKAAVRGFSDAYRYELEEGQYFQVLFPVATKTEFFKRAGNKTPIPWPTQNAFTVAKCAIKGIRRNKSKIFPSIMFRITNAVSSIFPFVLKIYVRVNNRAFKKWLVRKENNNG